MKAILYFVKGGKVRDSHKEAATAISAKTGKRVVFRNGSAAEQTQERPEPNDGVAGQIPSTYEAFATYDDKGKLTSEAAPLSLVETEGEVNDLGLPMGSPNDLEELRTALTDAGVAFHPRNKIDKLVSLYQTEILQIEPGNG